MPLILTMRKNITEVANVSKNTTLHLPLGNLLVMLLHTKSIIFPHGTDSENSMRCKEKIIPKYLLKLLVAKDN